MPTFRERSARLAAPRVAWTALAFALVVSCGGSDEPSPDDEGSGGAEDEAGNPADEADSKLRVQRELGAAYFGEDRFEEACQRLRWVIDQPGATTQDLVNYAAAEIAAAESDLEAAQAALERAIEADPTSAEAHFCLGVMARRDARSEEALAAFAKAVEHAPDDAPARIAYGDVLDDMDRDGDAIEQFRSVLAKGPEFAGSFYLTALYRAGSLLRRMPSEEQKEEGKQLLLERKRLTAEGLSNPSTRDLERGNLAEVRVPRPAAAGAGGDSPRDITFEAVDGNLGADAGAVRFVVGHDLDADKRPDLVVVGSDGVVIAKQIDGARFDEMRLDSGSYQRAVVGDLSNSDRLSIFLLGDEGVRLYAQSADGQFHATEHILPTNVSDLCLVDYDHDGDVDVLTATPDGLFLARNDGGPATPPRDNTLPETIPDDQPHTVMLTDVTARGGNEVGMTVLPATAFAWVTIEDFDADSDIDFLVGGPDQQTVVLSNLRKGRFEALPTSLPGEQAFAPVLRDFDGDARVDVMASAGLYRNDGDGTFGARQEVAGLNGDGPYVATDINLDAAWDVAGVTDDGLAAWAGAPLASPPTRVDLPGNRIGTMPPVLVDMDDDGDDDVLAAADRGVALHRSNVARDGGLFQIRLVGRKDNRQGVGAIVEVRSGERYWRHLSRGPRMSVGVADVDVIRVSWTNGVVQYPMQAGREEDPRPTSPLTILQKEGLVGSCPFLYTWNGSEYEFISDILGITPLGLPIEEGVYVPPDHDELVRVTSDQLKPVDGEYRMQVTEELREVTYLDRAELWVVDHSADVQAHPEERFTFPPFPKNDVHTVRTRLPVTDVEGSDGVDYTDTLATIDDDHAAPFQPLPSQFLGLVTPHHFTMTLPEEVRTAKRVRLLMTGWLYWTDASVNVAAGHHPDYAFVPPLLSVPDGQGGWRETGPPVGFPAGKTKTMLLDVTDMINRDDLRLRIFSTIRLYWDCIEVSVDDAPEPVRVTKLEPTQAHLFERGLSKPLPAAGPNQPERFDFEVLDEPRWDQHVGMLTKMGDVLPLLGGIDDQYVIFGTGESIDLRFDATLVPELAEGQARTFLLFVDGWAKDADPNTAFGGLVEPLPFHGMTAYPYGPAEGYPDTAATREYQATWNTRPGRRLIPAVVEPKPDALPQDP